MIQDAKNAQKIILRHVSSAIKVIPKMLTHSASLVHLLVKHAKVMILQLVCLVMAMPS